jgi:superfamily II DNA or RNA helicase
MSAQIPDLVDNQRVSNFTLAQVLVNTLSQAQSPTLWVATAYFNLDALEQLGDVLKQLKELRLLLGTEQEQAFVLTQRLAQELERHFALIHPKSQQMVEHWSQFLQQHHIHIRRYKKGFLHGKTYLLQGLPILGAIGIVGSSNFTGAGLTTNLELNAVLTQHYVTKELISWFEQLWKESQDYKQEIIDLLTQFTRALKPYEVYIKVLYEAYRDKLSSDLREQDSQPSPIELADFQREGYHAAREILEQYGGVLIADSVGLGKTYIALRLLDDYAYQQRQTALIICPAALRDTVWKRVLEEHAIPHRIESMERLSQSDAPIEELRQYSIIVIDESHNFRNPSSNRWRNTFEILRHTDPEKTRLILLTATPVNNSVYDLYHQVRLITRDDKQFFQIAGIDNLESYFRKASEDRDTLYELLEAIAVRRSRAFIRRNYPEAMIDGKRIHFPERRIHPVEYSLQAVYGDLYKRVADAITGLKLAPYQLESYRCEVLQSQYDETGAHWTELQQSLQTKGMTEEQTNKFRRELEGQRALAGLMRMLYLKRLESSVEALRKSLQHQREFQQQFLDMLQKGKLLTSSDYRRMLLLQGSDDEAEDNIQAFQQSLKEVNPTDYDMQRIQQDVEQDLDTLNQLLNELALIDTQKDAKLQKLLNCLQQKLHGEKVLIFSYYKDTARYLYNYLHQKLPNTSIALVTSDVKMEERLCIVQRFSPRSNPSTHDGEEIQILIATDALSEGQNLQDARILVNYDLHWNPIRMVQRIGRIDRIGSPHDTIEVYNFVPEDALDNLIRLMETLRDKLSQINQTVGLDASVLGEVPNPQDFNTLRRIAKGEKEVLEELETESELNIGEFLLQDLIRYLKELGEEHIGRLPLGRGTAKRASSPDQRGFFAAFRHLQTERHYWLFLREDGTLITERLKAIAPIRSEESDPPADLPAVEQTEEKLRFLRQELLRRLNQQAYQLPELPTVQKQIMLWLNALPPSALRNELIGYFRRPLPEPDLRSLRDLWKKAQNQAPTEMLQQLKAFADTHPHPKTTTTATQEVTEDDLECVAWMWLI